jgi:aspartate aminotransferase
LIKEKESAMKLAQRVSCIKPSATLSINAKANALKKQGVHIVNFGVGEPDFDTPQHIQEAAVQAMRDGHTRYTAVSGIDELKDAVLKMLDADYGLSYRRENVLVSCGAKHALYNLFQAILDPGDEVIIPVPYWVSYPEMVALAGGTPVFVPCLQQSGFKLQPEQLERAITPRTRLLLLNSPCNPTGVYLRRNDLAALAEVLLRHEHVSIASDDIYSRILFSGQEWANLAMANAALQDRIFIINGVSKTYCMTGWRIGYLIGEAPVVKAATDIQSQSTSNPTAMAQYASVAALDGHQKVVGAMVKVFEERCRYVVNRLAQLPGVTCPTPDGAFYVFPDCRSYYGRKGPKGVIHSSLDLTAYLMEEAHLAVVPGSAFGEDHCIRLSYALGQDDLKEGFDRLEKAFNSLSG